jgi:DNA-binding CsgD family transcriptional regulator
MFQLPTSAAMPAVVPAAIDSPSPAAAPAEPLLARWLAQSLDHVGRGMLVMTEGARLLHANRLARLALQGGHPLQVENGRLRAATAHDTQALHDALEAAMRRGVRRLLYLGHGQNVGVVAVLPLEPQGGGAALISLPQERGTQDLAVHSFARQYSFTGAETAVLEALLAGRRPDEIACAKGVQLSTVRTQIGQLRQKCGAHSIRELLDRVGALPPMLALVQ